MSKSRVQWITVGLSIVVLLVGILGMVLTSVLNSSVFGKADAYGTVPVPGSASLELPVGDVLVNYRYTQSSSSSSPTVPTLRLGITPPPGVAAPAVTDEDSGASTSGSEATAKVFVVHVQQAGLYRVEVGEPGFKAEDARLLFGYEGPYGWLMGPFAVVMTVGILAMIGSIFWVVRSDSDDVEPQVAPPVYGTGPIADGPQSYASAEDARLQRLKMIAGLRDSGALSEAEFEAEKRRILES